MATKKTASTAKKTTKKSAPVAKKTTTKVTTVNATPARTSRLSAVRANTARFKFSRAPLLGASVAEFVGMFVFAAIYLAVSGQPLFVLFGLVAVVLAVSALSGAHLNPALTIGAWATRRITAVRALSYLAAQVLGALLALVVLNAFIGAAPTPSADAAQYGQGAPTLFQAAAIPDGKEWVLLAAELLGTTIFAFVVAGAMRGRDKLVNAFTMGGGYYVALLISGTAASYIAASSLLNPALAASAQGISFELWPMMIYVLAPVVGGILGFALNDLLQAESEVVA